jgi:glutathione S-transferase
MQLYYFPISTYSQKVVIAFREKQIAFVPRIVSFRGDGQAEFKKIYPLGTVPLLVDDAGEQLPESTSIIERLERVHPTSGTRLVPADPAQAEVVRFWDRQIDWYLSESFSKIFFDGRKPEDRRDPDGVAVAKERLGVMFDRLDRQLATRAWIAGDAFSMADCAAAPPLGYLRMQSAFASFKNLDAYAGRLFERPSVASVLADAKPYLAALMGG